MAHDSTNDRLRAHELIDLLTPRQLAAVVQLLEVMIDPTARTLANAPANAEETPQKQVLAEFGLTPDDLHRAPLD